MNSTIEVKEKEPVVTTPRTTKNINLYAALGVAILVTALAGLVALLAAFVTASGGDYSGYNDAAPIMGLVASFLIIVLGLGIPALLGAKFGWRTVLMTIIIEALLVFIITSGFVLFAGSQVSDQPKAIYAEPAINE